MDRRVARTPSAMAWAVLVAMWRLLLVIVGIIHWICLAVSCSDFFYKGCNTNLSSAQTGIYSPTTCSLTPHPLTPSSLTLSPPTPEPGTGGRQSIVSFATGHHENHENRAKKASLTTPQASLTTPQTSLTFLLTTLVIMRPLLLHKIQMLVTMATC